MAQKPKKEAQAEHVMTMRLPGDVYELVLKERERRMKADPDGGWTVTRTIRALLRAGARAAENAS